MMALLTSSSSRLNSSFAHLGAQVGSTTAFTKRCTGRFRISCASDVLPAAIRIPGDRLDVERRSASYPPNSWDYKWLESLGTGKHDQEEGFDVQMKKMKDQVRGMIEERETPALDKLELIDAVQRLGIEYHFESAIEDAVEHVRAQALDGGSTFDDLHSTALMFRLLRNHGIDVQTDVFDKFTEKGRFKEVLRDDMNGILSLYEASFHSIAGETILDEARAFALSHMKNLDLDKVTPTNMAKKARRALDIPLRWRSNRSEARWFMDIYQNEPKSIPVLLRLAKLDFNCVQSYYRKEVGQLARWWMDLGLGDISALRDRLMEAYLWGNILGFEPQMGDFRVITSKILCLITIIDDCYDIFGTMEELQLLTDFIERWDIREIDKLPPTIRASYWALYNSTNEIAFQILKTKGVNILPHLTMMWATECKAYLQEARWYNDGYKPKLEEYDNNAVTSIGVYNVLFSYFPGTTDVLTDQAFDYVCGIPRIMHDASLVTRLNNDLGTSKLELERGDTLKAIQCHMNEHGTSEESAREAIEGIVHEAWKSMNEREFEERPNFVSKHFIQACLNMARSSHSFYRYGDGYGNPGRQTKDYIASLVIDPVLV